MEGKPGERHVFGVTDTTHKDPRNLTCLTCDVGPECLYNEATFSPSFSYYILECLGPGIPRVELRSTDTNALGTFFNSYHIAWFPDSPKSRLFYFKGEMIVIIIIVLSRT